jgi:hypothetical protein
MKVFGGRVRDHHPGSHLGFFEFSGGRLGPALAGPQFFGFRAEFQAISRSGPRRERTPPAQRRGPPPGSNDPAAGIERQHNPLIGSL